MESPHVLHFAPAPRSARQQTEHVFRLLVKFFGFSLWGIVRADASALDGAWDVGFEVGVPQNFSLPSHPPDISVAFDRSKYERQRTASSCAFMVWSASPVRLFQMTTVLSTDPVTM